MVDVPYLPAEPVEHSDMNLLAVETSGMVGSIALHREGLPVEERPIGAEGRRHARTLVADADRLMAEFELAPRDTHCVAVSIGPGSFTGLRVGIVFAKTFGWINKCPVVAVPTFDALAWQVKSDSARVGVVGDAQRGEVFFAEYQKTGGEITTVSQVEIASVDSVRTKLSEDTVLIGPGLDRYASEFECFCKLADPTLWRPAASSIAELGRAAFDTGNIADPWKLEPFYLRRSAAEEKRDAEQS